MPCFSKKAPGLNAIFKKMACPLFSVRQTVISQSPFSGPKNKIVLILVNLVDFFKQLQHIRYSFALELLSDCIFAIEYTHSPEYSPKDFILLSQLIFIHYDVVYWQL